MSTPFELNFTPAAMPYLGVQVGRLQSLVGDEAQWRAAYAQQLNETYAGMEQFIPSPLTSVLDIGGGMGAIDALLNHHHPDLRVTILDGKANAPAVAAKNAPYSSHAAAEEFLRENGVRDVGFIAPDALPTKPPKFDLILSVQSWCFHYMPMVYAGFALKCSRPGTVWMVDCRIRAPMWASDLFSQERLEPIGEAPGFNDKYTRMAFRVTA